MKIEIPALPVPRTSKPQTDIGRWLLSHPVESHVSEHHPWYRVLWLTGVDYFSTLSYQPGIALLAAGILSPIATILLVLVTLVCAVPTYGEVAKRSYAGQGSIAILENFLKGWWSKLTVLVLLGFAITDFIITMTLSSADAALHLTHNSFLEPYLSGHELGLTILLLTVLTLVFLKGFKEAIQIAMLIAIPFIVLTFITLTVGVIEVFKHPELWTNWHLALFQKQDPIGIFIASAILFPRLALGMSGFETGVSVMPLIKDDEASVHGVPTTRIRDTKKMLWTAALIMSVALILSSFVTTLLIPSNLATTSEIEGRAISYLAHHFLGQSWGSLYDFSTVLILWFAGASALAALLHLIARYLPRYGMAPRWIAYQRPLILTIFVVAIAVTIFFDADVKKQAGAYATGVLALMLSASVAVFLVIWKEESTKRIKRHLKAFFFLAVSAVFLFALVDNIILRPDGLYISLVFIGMILILSAISRWQRSLELRVDKITFQSADSQELWQNIVGKKCHLVPCRTNSREHRAAKFKDLKESYKFTGPVAFLHIRLMDNQSEFLSTPNITVTMDGSNYVIKVTGAVAIANMVAYISELLDPISLFIGLTGEDLMTQAFRYLIWGQGETGLLVYRILINYWEWTPEKDVRPQIFLMSDPSN